MLFNSQEFLFVFLPVTLLGFYLLGSVSTPMRRSCGLSYYLWPFTGGGGR